MRDIHHHGLAIASAKVGVLTETGVLRRSSDGRLSVLLRSGRHSPSMKRPLPLSALIAGFALAIIPVQAHHSAKAEFDASEIVTLHGIVTRVDWINPHARFYVDVKGDSGKVKNWEFEWGSPNGLMRAGWTRTSLQKGDEVTVRGWRAKDNENLVNAMTIALADGKPILPGASPGQDPSTK